MGDEESIADPPYRVVYVAQRASRLADDYGGLIARLDDEGFRVSVFAGDDGGLAGLEDRGAQVRRLPAMGAVDLPAAVGAFFIVQGAIIEREPVLVHGFGDVAAWIGAAAGHRARTPAVFASPDAGFLGRSAGLGRWTPRFASPGVVAAIEDRIDRLASRPRRALRDRIAAHTVAITDVCLAATDRDREVLVDVGEEGEHVERTAPRGGVDVAHFDPDAEDVPDRDEVRRRLRIPDRWRTVLGVSGAMRPDRGAAALLHCIEEVTRRHPGVGWLLHPGDGLAAGVQRELEPYIGRGRLVVCEEDADRRSFFRALDLYVAPGDGADVPRAVLEAASMETAVVGRRGAGLETVVRDGQTGRLVDQRSDGALADAVESLVADPGRLGDFSIRGRTVCRERFDRRDVHAEILGLYDRVLESKLATE